MKRAAICCLIGSLSLPVAPPCLARAMENEASRPQDGGKGSDQEAARTPSTPVGGYGQAGFAGNDLSIPARPPVWLPDLGEQNCQSLDTSKRNFLAAGKRADGETPGSAQHLKWTRRAIDAGYCWVWALLDMRAADEAHNGIRRMEGWLSAYERPTPIGQARLGLARLAWLKSRIASEADRTAEDNDMVRRTLELTVDREVYLPDYSGLSALRIVALWKGDDDVPGELQQNEACEIAREMEHLLGGSATRRIIECHALEADKLLGRRDEPALLRMIGDAVEMYKKRPSIRNGLSALRVRMREVFLATSLNQTERAARLEFGMLEELSTMLSGQSYSQHSPDELYSLYRAISCECAAAIPEYLDDKARYEKTAQVYGRLSNALATSLATYPQNLSIAGVAADASATAANAFNRAGDHESASIYAERAVRIVDGARLLDQLAEFSEQGAFVCKVYGKAVETQIGLKSQAGSATAMASLDANCGEWLKRYPWDFYARQHYTSAKWKYGMSLADSGKTIEALPFLEFASNWGIKDGSMYLARIYRDIFGLLAHGKIAKSKENLAKQQSMKRFTVPTEFDGVKYPFHVYISHYGAGLRCPADRALRPEEENCVGFAGIDDQVTWVKNARGGVIPADIIVSFRKLDGIARNEGVSFPELAADALGGRKEAE